MSILKTGTISESTIQKKVFNYIRGLPKPYKDCIFSIQNEGKRSLKRGAISKGMGLQSGVSDIFVMIPKQGYHGAWIELKSAKGRLSPAQASFLERARTQGYYTQVTYSYEDTITFINWYLEITAHPPL